MKENVCKCKDNDSSSSFRMDSISKRVAENMTGQAIMNHVLEESHLFAANTAKKPK